MPVPSRQYQVVGLSEMESAIRPRRGDAEHKLGRLFLRVGHEPIRVHTDIWTSDTPSVEYRVQSGGSHVQALKQPNDPIALPSLMCQHMRRKGGEVRHG